MAFAAAGALALTRESVEAKEPDVPTTKPNILFLMTDQHRGDCLGCAGSPVRTPNLDRIAKEGVLFSQAYSSTPSCTPARAAILTGLSPWRHGMLGYGRVARRYSFELLRAMNDAGYHTFAIGKLHYHPQRNYHGFSGALIDESGRVESPGFESDYRRWFREKAPGLDPDATGIGWNDYRSAPYALPEELHPTRWTGDRAVEFLRDYREDKPFFLKVSFARPHSPYDPPARLLEMYDLEDIPAPHVGDWAGRYAPVADRSDYSLWHGDLGVEQARESRRGYYGSVSFIDEQIGRILGVLESRQMLSNTLIVFAADHGDMLGDHHLWRKTYAYDGSARVPMLMRLPERLEAARRGSGAPVRVIDRVVELRDLLPTFLDAAGADVPSGLDGDSLLKLVPGGGHEWRECIDLEHSACYDRELAWNALTDGKSKYVYWAWDGREQLFDLVDDPAETRDLAGVGSRRRQLEAWRERMIQALAERGEGFVSEGRLALRPNSPLYSPNYPDDPNAK